MSRGECVGNLNGDQERALQLERVPANQLPYVATFDVLHGDEVVSFGFVEIEDSADVWMIERGGEARFALKALEVCFSGGQLSGQDFDYNRAAKLSVRSFVHGALPANAELFENLVISQELSDHDSL